MTSRRQDLLDAALAAFTVNGYEGTPVSAIVETAGMSKAAFTYHFETKESLLIELVTPLLDALDKAIEDPQDLDWPEDVEALLGRYLDALTTHRRLAIWIDGDKSVLHHPLVGARLTANNQKMRQLIAGNRRRGPNVSAAAALGAIWRPIRNLTDTDLTTHRAEVLDAAIAAAQTGHDPGVVVRD